MASTLNALFGALAATMFWTILGLAIGRRLLPAALAWPAAPALGWAVHSAATLPIFMGIGFSAVTVGGVVALVLVASIVSLARTGPPVDLRPPVWAWIGAALFAMTIAVAILPKTYGDSVVLSSAIFDHSKLPMIDEMVRNGVPPGNPFFGEVGSPPRLAYYYLYYYSAAGLALLTGLSGWEADIALTWFAAFASLTLMMGLASWFGRPSAVLWVLPLAASASMRPLFYLLFEWGKVDAVIWNATGFAGWQSQAAWVPQHLMSANCVVVAVLLLSQLAKRQSPLLIAAFVLVVVAGFQSSTWVGGVTFAVAALLAGGVLLLRAEPPERWPFVASVAVAAVLVLCLAAPFLYDQNALAQQRVGGFPVAVIPYHVLSTWFPQSLRRVLDLPAYWLVFLVIEFPAIYITGAVVMTKLARSRELDAGRKRIALALAALTVASLSVSWLLNSRIANNDLGWRAILPGAMVLTAFSAAGLARWLAARNVIAAAAALVLLALGMPEGIAYLRENAFGKPPGDSARVFARTPAMWEAVRRHSSSKERVGNNPHFLGDLTPWSVNISWALLSNRNSCFASEPLVLAYTPLSYERRWAIDAQFVRVFAGEGSPDDVGELASKYLCRLIVVTAQDKAWTRDPFAVSPLYGLVEEKAGEWRIYELRPSADAGG